MRDQLYNRLRIDNAYPSDEIVVVEYRQKHYYIIQVRHRAVNHVDIIGHEHIAFIAGQSIRMM